MLPLDLEYRAGMDHKAMNELFVNQNDALTKFKPVHMSSKHYTVCVLLGAQPSSWWNIMVDRDPEVREQ